MAQQKDNSANRTTNVLLGIISGLLTFFGSISYDVIKDMNNKLDLLSESDVRKGEQIQNLQKQMNDSRTPMVFAKHEEEITVEKIAKR
jgi:hypothetical protein